MPVNHAHHTASSAPLPVRVDELVAREDDTSAIDLVRTALRQLQVQDASRAQATAQQPATVERV